MKNKKQRKRSSDDSSSDAEDIRSHKPKKRPRDSDHSKHESKSNEKPRSESRRRSPGGNKNTRQRRISPESRRRKSRSPSKEDKRTHPRRKDPKHSSGSHGAELTSQQRIDIKKEEDFDIRQEELRRKRRREGNDHTDHQASNIRVKEEPDSDHDRRRTTTTTTTTQRNQDDRRRQARNRRDEERRNNEEMRREEWGRREREGGGNAEALAGEEAPIEKEKPNLGLSGALTEDTNSYKGVVIKYNEPPEARVPKKKWRLYPFKGDEALKVLHLHRQSAYLLGRLRRIADIPIDHPSCSKQHAVFQFRLVEENRNGRKRRIVKPYIIDLESGNGTFVNNVQIDPRRYVELKEQDIIKFGFSSREYVLLHDKSDTTEIDSEESEENDTD